MKVEINEKKLEFELQPETDADIQFMKKFTSKFFKDPSKLGFSYGGYNLSFRA